MQSLQYQSRVQPASRPAFTTFGSGTAFFTQFSEAEPEQSLSLFRQRSSAQLATIPHYYEGPIEVVAHEISPMLQSSQTH